MKAASTPMYTEVPFAKLKDYLEKKTLPKRSITLR